jgi:hypothetical protein
MEISEKMGTDLFSPWEFRACNFLELGKIDLSPFFELSLWGRVYPGLQGGPA